MKNTFLYYGLSGFLMIALSIPLILRKIKINHWYGIRLPETMKDDDVWFEANSLGGKLLLKVGLIILILNGALYFQNIIPDIYGFVFSTIFIFVSVIGLAIKSSKLATDLSHKKTKTVLN